MNNLQIKLWYFFIHDQVWRILRKKKILQILSWPLSLFEMLNCFLFSFLVTVLSHAFVPPSFYLRSSTTAVVVLLQCSTVSITVALLPLHFFPPRLSVKSHADLGKCGGRKRGQKFRVLPPSPLSVAKPSQVFGKEKETSGEELGRREKRLHW